MLALNQKNIYVLKFLCSTKHNLQVHNLALCSLKGFDLDLVNFFLCLSFYFIALFLDKLGPYYLGNFWKWLCNSFMLILWLHATPIHSRLDYNWCYNALESPTQLGNSNDLHALAILGWLISELVDHWVRLKSYYWPSTSFNCSSNSWN